MFKKIATSSYAARRAAVTAAQKRNASMWSYLEPISLDQTKVVAMAFKKDTSPNKISLGEGIYADDNGKSYVLPAVAAVRIKCNFLPIFLNGNFH